MALFINGKNTESLNKLNNNLSFGRLISTFHQKKSNINQNLSPLAKDVIKISKQEMPFLMSENLISRTTPEQRNMLEDLYKNHFVPLSQNKIFHSTSPIIDQGALLHGTPYNKNLLESIFKDGLISIDLGTNLKETNNSQTTIGGIDTWVNTEKRTIDEYFNKWLAECPDFATSPFQKMNRQMLWRGENKWIDLAAKDGDKVVFVLNPTKNKELQAITQYSVTPQTKGLPSTVMGGNMTNQENNCMYETPAFERHTFVPVGIPSNYIEKIIVGKNISSEQVYELKELLYKYDLDTKVFNVNGDLL